LSNLPELDTAEDRAAWMTGTVEESATERKRRNPPARLGISGSVGRITPVAARITPRSETTGSSRGISIMTDERITSSGETAGERDDEFHAGRRARSRWWEKPDTWDPDRWKAMASAWKSIWQDGADGAEKPTEVATKTCPYCAEQIKPAAVKCKHCRTWLAPPPEPFAYFDAPAPSYNDPTFGGGYPRSVRLTRSTADAMACGVLGGLARFVGVDPTWLRIAYALGTFFTAFIPGIVVYGMLALIIPSDAPAKGQGAE
jgi:phage shock protein PspC (stress-responsive transcriptional regulator)